MEIVKKQQLANCEALYFLMMQQQNNQSDDYKNRTDNLIEFLKQNSRSIEESKIFIETLKQFPLSQFEKSQIVNLLPKNEIQLHLIVENCDERLTHQQIQQLIHLQK